MPHYTADSTKADLVAAYKARQWNGLSRLNKADLLAEMNRRHAAATATPATTAAPAGRYTATWKVHELRDECAKRKWKGLSRLNKPELLVEMNKRDAAATATPAANAPAPVPSFVPVQYTAAWLLADLRAECDRQGWQGYKRKNKAPLIAWMNTQTQTRGPAPVPVAAARAPAPARPVARTPAAARALALAPAAGAAAPPAPGAAPADPNDGQTRASLAALVASLDARQWTDDLTRISAQHGVYAIGEMAPGATVMETLYIGESTTGKGGMRGRVSKHITGQDGQKAGSYLGPIHLKHSGRIFMRALKMDPARPRSIKLLEGAAIRHFDTLSASKGGTNPRGLNQRNGAGLR